MKAYNKFIQTVIVDEGPLVSDAFDDVVTAKVVSFGEEIKGIKVNDLIIFNRRNSVEYTTKGIKYRYTTLEAIMAVESPKK